MAQPVKGVAYDFPVGLEPTDGTGFLPNPTISTGDFKIQKDYGDFTDLETLPVVTPVDSGTVKISLSATEMNADKIVISIKDLLGDEWRETRVFIDVPPNVTLTDLQTITQSTLDIIEGDHVETRLSIVINKKDTSTPVLSKTVAGSLLSDNVTITTLET